MGATGRDQFPLRFPDGMRDRIKAAAAVTNRTMNAEIVHRLEAFEIGGIGISDEAVAKLDALSAHGPYRISTASIIERGIELAALELDRLK